MYVLKAVKFQPGVKKTLVMLKKINSGVGMSNFLEIFNVRVENNF